MSKRFKELEKAKEDLRERRELAKTGMTVSLGAVLLTGMLKKKKAHIVSGVAFMGFAYWHTTLYARNPNKRKSVDPVGGAKQSTVQQKSRSHSQQVIETKKTLQNESIQPTPKDQ